MRAICVDDEVNALQLIEALCRRLPQLDQVEAFTSSADALEWMHFHPVDLVLLDVDMPGITGLEMAKIIQKEYPDTAIIFLTGFPEFAVEAFALHVAGYMLKPVSRERLLKEVNHALEGRMPKPRPKVEIQTFGYFNLLVDGKAVKFGRAKSKELLAYLVDRQGSVVNRGQIFYTLWEDRPYDRPMQKQLDVIIRNLRNTLAECGAGDILAMDGGSFRVVPELFNCDLYRFLNGEPEEIRQFRGEYMSDYSWAEETAGKLTMIKQNSESTTTE